MKKIALLTLLILAACAPAVDQPSVVLPQTLPSATAFIAESYPTTQVQVASPDQIASGIEVRMDSVAMVGKDVNANVCFTLPDNADWSIWSASLNYAGVILQEYGTTLASLQEPANGQPGQRCDTLTFVVPPDADLTNASIVIDAIAALPRAGEYCSIYMPKIQQSMLERGIGISLDCVDVNGVLTMQITSIPPEMTQEQAEQIVYSDEFYTVKGPWAFSFNLSQ